MLVYNEWLTEFIRDMRTELENFAADAYTWDDAIARLALRSPTPERVAIAAFGAWLRTKAPHLFDAVNAADAQPPTITNVDAPTPKPKRTTRRRKKASE